MVLLAFDVDPAYIAGLFDSDGSFTISKHSRKDMERGYDYRIYAQLSWREIPETVSVLEQIKARYGGSVIPGIQKGGYANGKRYVKYAVNAKKACGLLKDILPFLRIKRRQAELCYKVADGMKAGRFNKWHPHTEEDWDEIEVMRQEVASLNRKNGKGKGVV